MPPTFIVIPDEPRSGEDPGPRGDARRARSPWVPAFAGMTGKGGNSL
jgi:hypothetical protein